MLEEPFLNEPVEFSIRFGISFLPGMLRVDDIRISSTSNNGEGFSGALERVGFPGFLDEFAPLL